MSRDGRCSRPCPRSSEEGTGDERAVDIEYSEPPRGLTPLENALDTRFPGTTVLSGERRVRVVSKIKGERQWTIGPRLRSFLAEWEVGHPVKPGWFRLKRIKTGG